MNAKDIIHALGGATKLSQSVGIPRSRIANWQTDGIPGSYWPAIVRAAKAAGVEDITMDVLERHRMTPAQDAAA